MELKDLSLHTVFLSGRAHKICRTILESTKTKRKDQSYAEVINRVIVDYAKEDVGNKEERLLRLYYLSLSLKDSMVWNRGTGTNVSFRKPAMEMIREFQKFAKKKKLFVNVQEAPNVIIHDYIDLMELKGKDFTVYYLEKHLIQSI